MKEKKDTKKGGSMVLPYSKKERQGSQIKLVEAGKDPLPGAEKEGKRKWGPNDRECWEGKEAPKSALHHREDKRFPTTNIARRGDTKEKRDDAK